VEGLRKDGHDVLYVKEIAPGTDDSAVLQMAASQQRVLLTEDKDFGLLVVRLKLPAYGIILPA
jgi:predicted nuclease of predicted toxin-antitoxin system